MPDLYVKVVTTAVSPANVVGATVKLYNSTNTSLIASDTTGANGEASFVGVAAGSYYLRLKGPSTPYEFTSGATQGVTMAAVDTRATVTMDDFTEPTTTEANYCRCWGYFIALDGSAAAQRSIYFQHNREEEDPAALLYTVGTTTQSRGFLRHSGLEVITDDSGYAEVDLPRNASLLATVPAFHNVPIEVEVPDAAGANLVDILFPFPSEVKFYSSSIEVNNLLMSVGDETTLDMEVILRSGLVSNQSSLFISLTEPTGLSISMGDDSATFTADAAGTYVIAVTAQADAQYILPVPTITIDLTVEVS